MLNSEKPFGKGDVMARKRYSAEQIIVNLREADIIESKGLTQLEADLSLDKAILKDAASGNL